MLAPAEQAQTGRGGSVSRRDHNQAYWKRAHSQADPTPKQRPNSIASRSSGGGPGEGLLSEKPPPPEYSHATASGGSAREGLLVEKLPPSQTLFTFLLGSADQFLEGVQRVSLLGVEGQGSDQRVANGNHIVTVVRHILVQIGLVLESVQINLAVVQRIVGQIVRV